MQGVRDLLTALRKPRSKAHGVQPVFGRRLEDLGPDEQVEGVPTIVYKMVNFLVSTEAYNEEGLFRVSGQLSEVRGLKERFDRGEDVDLVAMYGEPHVVCSTLKLFFRELPEPLFTFELYDCFMIADVICADKERVEQIKHVLGIMPAGNFTLTSYLVKFLRLVAQHSDKNKMKSNNLATVFAPNVLRSLEDDMLTNTAQSSHILQTMIDDFEYLFPEAANLKYDFEYLFSKEEPPPSVDLETLDEAAIVEIVSHPANAPPPPLLPKPTKPAATAAVVVSTPPRPATAASTSGPAAKSSPQKLRSVVPPTPAGGFDLAPLSTSAPSVPAPPPKSMKPNRTTESIAITSKLDYTSVAQKLDLAVPASNVSASASTDEAAAPPPPTTNGLPGKGYLAAVKSNLNRASSVGPKVQRSSKNYTYPGISADSDEAPAPSQAPERQSSPEAGEITYDDDKPIQRPARKVPTRALPAIPGGLRPMSIYTQVRTSLPKAEVTSKAAALAREINRVSMHVAEEMEKSGSINGRPKRKVGELDPHDIQSFKEFGGQLVLPPLTGGPINLKRTTTNGNSAFKRTY